MGSLQSFHITRKNRTFSRDRGVQFFPHYELRQQPKVILQSLSKLYLQLVSLPVEWVKGREVYISYDGAKQSAACINASASGGKFHSSGNLLSNIAGK